MTPEAQRIAIAEFCGWKVNGKHSPCVSSSDDGLMRISPDGQSCVTASLLPDYLNDLNAMREAESRLTEKSQQDAYCLELAKICNALKNWNKERMNVVAWLTVRATAAQRAEAILSTIGRLQITPTRPHRQNEGMMMSDHKKPVAPPVDNKFVEKGCEQFGKQKLTIRSKSPIKNPIKVKEPHAGSMRLGDPIANRPSFEEVEETARMIYEKVYTLKFDDLPSQYHKDRWKAIARVWISEQAKLAKRI